MPVCKGLSILFSHSYNKDVNLSLLTIFSMPSVFKTTMHKMGLLKYFSLQLIKRVTSDFRKLLASVGRKLALLGGEGRCSPLPSPLDLPLQKII